MNSLHKKHSVEILGVRINTYSKSEVFSIVESFIQSDAPHLIWSVNVDPFMQLTKDGKFRDIYEAADLVLADGMPLVWISRLFGNSIPERITGIDFLEEFAPIAEKKGYSYFFVTSSEKTLTLAKQKLQEKFPRLVIHTYAPPFSPRWTKKESEAIVDAIATARPDILFVGVGAPRQEKWIYQNWRRLNVPVALGIGGALEMVAGFKKRAPRWMQNAGLEWFFRFLQDPWRLWRRYMINMIQFPCVTLLSLIQRKARKPC